MTKECLRARDAKNFEKAAAEYRKKVDHMIPIVKDFEVEVWKQKIPWSHKLELLNLLKKAEGFNIVAFDKLVEKNDKKLF